MQIKARQIGKKFGDTWIFKKMSYSFETGKKYAIIGKNGTGKSTLLQCLSSAMLLSKGKIDYIHQSQNLTEIEVSQKMSLATPYMSLPENLTLKECVTFYHRFCPMEVSVEECIKLLNLENQKSMFLKNFSSGMLQRLKLGLTYYSHAPLVLLDEPTSFLDETYINWYSDLFSRSMPNQTLIIATNQKKDYAFCDAVINVENYSS